MDPFVTLGLPRRYQLDLRQLETNYRELQRVLHPDRHGSAAASQRRMNLLKAVEVNEAYRTLKNEVTRAEALLALYAAGAPPEARQEDPEFLMEVLELREELSEAHAAGDVAAVRVMADRAHRAKLAIDAQLGGAFETLSQGVSKAELTAARKLLGRLKYYHRFLDEVSAFEQRTEEQG
jgi:molecular chaperone HscB